MAVTKDKARGAEAIDRGEEYFLGMVAELLRLKVKRAQAGDVAVAELKRVEIGLTNDRFYRKNLDVCRRAFEQALVNGRKTDKTNRDNSGVDVWKGEVCVTLSGGGKESRTFKVEIEFYPQGNTYQVVGEEWCDTWTLG